MDSQLLKVEYTLEVSLAHSATFGKVYDVPSVFLPILLSAHPLGAIAPVVNFTQPTNLLPLQELPLSSLPGMYPSIE
jgi:hypothetical protein